MLKQTLSLVGLTLSLSANAVILNDGDSYSDSFALQSYAEGSLFTDFYWQVLVAAHDSANSPFASQTGPDSTITLTLYENTNFTGEVFSDTQDASNWLGDYGLFFTGPGFYFDDHDGSFTVSFNGGVAANFFEISIGNYSGNLAPSNIASAVLYPTVSQVPVPAAAWLFGSALIGLVGIKRKK